MDLRRACRIRSLSRIRASMLFVAGFMAFLPLQHSPQTCVVDRLYSIISVGDQSRLTWAAVVIELPVIGQGSIQSKEVVQPALVTASNRLGGNIVATTLDAISNAVYGHFCGGQP